MNGLRSLLVGIVGCLIVVATIACDVEELEAEVIRDYAEGAIRITNKNDFTWYGLKVKLNGRYENVYLLQTISWEPGQTATIYFRHFVDSSGTRFDPDRQVPLDVEMWTRRTPDGSYHDAWGKYSFRSP